MTENLTSGTTEKVRHFYRTFGPSKKMHTGVVARDYDTPNFFLVRKMFGVSDLLVIFATSRCRFDCSFCDLPSRAAAGEVTAQSIVRQFVHSIEAVRHSLGVIEHVTLSNDGSVLDDLTFPRDALDAILLAIVEIRPVRIIEIESRLEFASNEYLSRLSRLAPNVRFSILTGFETVNSAIRSTLLGKQFSLRAFERALDRLSVARVGLTAYVLYKPDPSMSEAAAIEEAGATVDYLESECRQRGVSLKIRLNPMYGADRSKWLHRAKDNGIAPEEAAPDLRNVLMVARDVLSRGLPIHIGLSDEGLASNGWSYRSRLDYSVETLRDAIKFNYGQVTLST